MNRTDFQRLGDLRIAEFRVLLTAGMPEGAYYLAGYAVECALKSCIARRTQEHDFPDKKLANDSHGGQTFGDQYVEDAFVYRIG